MSSHNRGIKKLYAISWLQINAAYNSLIKYGLTNRIHEFEAVFELLEQNYHEVKQQSEQLRDLLRADQRLLDEQQSENDNLREQVRRLTDTISQYEQRYAPILPD